jgi:hypothetical protein
VSSTSFPSPLVEGDHNITATYSGVTNTYNASTGNLWENTATTFSGAGTSQSPALFCNPGGITLPNQVENPTEEGAAAPNPSNIFVNNLPGTISSVEVELEQFQNTTAVDTITATASLLVGPGATSSNSLNFFTGTGAPDNSTVLSLGNYYFSDSGSEPVPESNYGPGIYQPASYSLVQVNNTFTPSLSGFYTLPGSFDYAQPHDPAYTFGDLYNTTNPNGTWSLYFNQYTSTDSVSATAAGWCMGFVENLPGATVTTESTDTFTQGQQNAPFMVNITNNGPGPTGDQWQQSDDCHRYAELGVHLYRRIGHGLELLDASRDDSDLHLRRGGRAGFVLSRADAEREREPDGIGKHQQQCERRRRGRGDHQ